jgi:hypothetical protein
VGVAVKPVRGKGKKRIGRRSHTQARIRRLHARLETERNPQTRQMIEAQLFVLERWRFPPL